MSNLKFPRLWMYWQSKYHVPIISETITRSRLLFIHTNLGALSGEEPMNNINRYWKIHPVVEIVRHGCRALEPEEFNSIGEQMIPFHGHASTSKTNPILLASNHLFTVGNPVRHMTSNFSKELVQEFQQSILT